MSTKPATPLPLSADMSSKYLVVIPGKRPTHFADLADAFAAAGQKGAVCGHDGRPVRRDGSAIRICGHCGEHIWYDGRDRMCECEDGK